MKIYEMWSRFKRAISPRSSQPLELAVKIKHQGERPSDQLSGEPAARARVLEDEIAHTKAELELLNRNLTEGRINKKKFDTIFPRLSYNLYTFQTEYLEILRQNYRPSSPSNTDEASLTTSSEPSVEDASSNENSSSSPSGDESSAISQDTVSQDDSSTQSD